MAKPYRVWVKLTLDAFVDVWADNKGEAAQIAVSADFYGRQDEDEADSRVKDIDFCDCSIVIEGISELK